jgi:hypothetical protein
MAYLCQPRDACTPWCARRSLGVVALEPEQERAIERMSRFLDSLTERLGRLDTDDDDDGKEQGNASPKGAAQRVARVVNDQEKS